ncbi:MAG TPA: DegV family protein [Candidatus Aquilonibacter sp.]
MGVTVITDSGSDFANGEPGKYGIEIVPIWIIFGDSRLRDGIDIDRETFFARMAAGELPTTQPPSQAQFAEVFGRAVNAGNDVVMVTLSSQISECFANATQAASAFGGRVHVVDSRGASGLETLLALYAVELAKAGTPASEIARRLSPGVLKSASFFAVPDLSVLGRSGRLPKAVVALGSMLNVSLVLKMNDQGAIGPAGQSFSFDKTCEIMVEAVVRAVEHSPNARIAFGHVQAAATVAKLSKLMAEKLGHPPVVEISHEAPLTIASHMGTGAIGIFAIVP